MRSDNPPLGIRQELAWLLELREGLARQLVAAADQLQSPTFPPSRTLIEAVEAYAIRYQRLVATLRLEQDKPTLDELANAVESRDCRKFAVQTAGQIAELTHVDLPDFAPLDLCQHEAARLCALAQEADGCGESPELQLLREQRHPLNSLLRLCDDGEQLSDADWTVCHDHVVATYGQQLAMALTRGRIQRRPRIAAANVSPPAPGVPATVSTATAEPRRAEPAAPPEPAAKPVHELASTSVFAETPALRASTVKLTGRDRASAGQSTSVPWPAPATGPRPESSAGMPQRRPHDSVETWIARLLQSDRLTQAQHLVHCVEAREGRSHCPPSWLLRAVVLGRHLSYSKGEITRQLDEELREFQTESTIERTAEQRLAMSFYLRAASLPATLLAGSTVAAGILRSFRIAPGFSQLYNYCSRIAQHGDCLANNLVELVPPAADVVDPAELDRLAQSAKEWLAQTARRVSNYERSSPLSLHAHWTLMAGSAIRHPEAAALWCKWQETLLLASRLLRPVCGHSDADWIWVRHEISRLTSQIRVEPLDLSHHANPQAAPGIVLPLEEMHAVILEAVAIANHWLRLNPAQASHAAAPIPVEILELRDEILGRSAAVLAELKQHDQTASDAVRAAIASCRAAVCQIQAIFEGRQPLPLIEPDPRHILSADLLRVPGLELDEQWQPIADPATVERELLLSLEGPELSWRDCFECHARAGHRDATSHLLELDVWSNDEERERLKELRQTQLGQARAGLMDELDEFTVVVESALLSESWTDDERAAMTARLEQLRDDASRTENIATLRHQFDQLQTAILRRHSPQPSPAFDADRGSVAGRPLASVIVPPA